MKPKNHLLFSSLITVVLASGSAHAADGTWNSDADGNWNSATNPPWNSGTPADGSGFTAFFNGVNLTADRTVTLGANRTIGNLNFGDTNTATAGGWLVTGNTLTLAGGTPTITVGTLGTGKVVTIASTLAGTSGFTKAGAGTLTLSGANTYTGGTTVSAGLLRFQDSSAGAANYAANANSTLEFNVTTGSRKINGGSLTGAGTFVKSGAGQLLIGSQGSAQNVSLSSGGLIDVQGGLLRNEFALGLWGSNLADLNVDSGAYFDLWDGNVRVDAITGTGTINKGWNTNQTLTFGVDNGSGTFSGTISSTNAPVGGGYTGSSGGTFGLTKQGTGTQTLSGTNTYTGTTTVSAGTLTIASAGTINGTSGVSIGAGEFNYNSATALTKGVTFSGTGGRLSGTGTITPSVTISAGNTLAPGNSIGTLSFGTNLTLAGTYSVELGTAGATPAAGLSDRTVVTGTLALGGNLTLVNNSGANGNGSAGAGAYRIATSTGATSGTFSSITNPMSATLHEKVVYGTNTTDLNLYRLATASTTPTTVTLANQRVGGTASQAITVTNTAANDGFSEGLNASGSAASGLTTSGSISNLLPSGGSSTAISVGVNTSTAGAKSGNVTLNLASNGATTSGYGTTALSNQTVAVSGSVFNAASANTIASVDVGKTRVGGTLSGTATLNVSNTAPSGAFTEGLNASVGSTSGGASGSGSISNLAGGASSTAISLSIAGANTSTSGIKSGTVDINLASSGTNSGLSNLGLSGQTVGVSGTVYDYADAVFSQTGGDGTFGGSGSSYTLNFGTGLLLNTTYSATIQLANNLLSGFQDILGGGYNNIANGFASGVEGTTIASLVAGSNNSFTITFNTGSTGTFNDTLSFSGLSQQSGLSDASLGNFNIALSAVAIPEPNVAALLGGLGTLLLLRRRRRN